MFDVFEENARKQSDFYDKSETSTNIREFQNNTQNIFEHVQTNRTHWLSCNPLRCFSVCMNNNVNTVGIKNTRAYGIQPMRIIRIHLTSL